MLKRDFSEIKKRKTFAIISHPDSGKTTITEKILLLGNIIRCSSINRIKKSNKNLKSDWMKIEQERGITVTTSVVQFFYGKHVINLLDTPGHEDFSEDTYRILTAVDFCLIIIDSSKGVEDRTKKLMEVVSLHNIPILTFINKIDREGISTIFLLDQIEKELEIFCSPIVWPLGRGGSLKGIYNFQNSSFISRNIKGSILTNEKQKKLEFINIEESLKSILKKKFEFDIFLDFKKELKLVKKKYFSFSVDNFLDGIITPVFFGSALHSIGIAPMFDFLIKYAPTPKKKKSDVRIVFSNEKKFSGFVFKIQANMDLRHRDRIAFLRIVSGKYFSGIKLKQTRTGKFFIIRKAIYCLGNERKIVNKAYPGDIIGICNNNSIKIGDTFTEGEQIKFLGIPNFSPEFFCSVSLKNPMKKKQLSKGLTQMFEEGAIQIFKPIVSNCIILGAVGKLQFDVISRRLQIEYQVEIVLKKVNIVAIRWVFCNDIKKLRFFKNNNSMQLAFDNEDYLVYIATSLFELKMIVNKNPNIIFKKFREC
ncbi:Peptide chain release factor RF3 [Buchnera aphidicola (Tetraneura ulmi)]|uniref:peptide chain release factor 3 n=1 Tax=Buchnera aphidicola TaxID=9 RepID=UPI003463ADCF